MRMLRHLLLLFFIVVPFAATAGDAIDVSNATSYESIGKKLQVYIGDKKESHPKDIIKVESNKWQPVNEDVPNFGFSEKNYWFKTTVKNPGEQKQEWLFISKYPLLDEIDFYVIDEGKIVTQLKGGDSRHFSTRPINHRFDTFPIKVAPGKEFIVLFRVYTGGSAQFPLDFKQQTSFFEGDQIELAVQVLFMGIMMAIAGYNLVLFIFIREASYLYYVAYITSYSLMQFTMRGLGYQWVWPYAVGWNESILLYSLVGTVMFAGLFSIKFLDLKENQHFLYKVMTVQIAVSIGCLFASFIICYSIVIQFIVVLVMAAAITMMVCGISQWSSGKKAARIYAIAWTTFWIGAVMVALNRFGIIPRSFVFENATQIGATVEAFLLSLALAERINAEKRKVIDLHETLLSHQKEATEKLERRVKERTEELQKTMEELDRLRTVDALTQTRNRAFFDDTIKEEWQRAIRSETTLALLIIDIDHFKRINDTYGHLAGDGALKQVAALIADCVKRPADSISRYGGEEFAVLLPHTTYDGAMLLAERIRKGCEENDFIIEEGRLKITLSVGVAAAKSPNPGKLTLKDLIAAADKELYKCKSGGRNQISGCLIEG
ncbi:MAG: diguanylate cyclase [Gammaproteobacteria bacterium]|nr:MAG: diguanylate cyclase [Gammaproteobacteria bacterium]